MASGREQTDEYHQQFAKRIIRALKEGTAPWQKAWQPGEHVLPRNFSSGHGYRGGNALYLAMAALDRGYGDPRWGDYRQIREAGGHVRNGEKGTPILYVDWRQRRTARDEHGDPVLDGEGETDAGMGSAGPAVRQAPLRLQRGADRGAGTAVAPGRGAGVGRT